MATLITGWSGTGKSTLCQELLSRDIDAIDTDAATGLCGWVDIETGINYGRECPEDFSSLKYDWRWDSEALQKALLNHPSAFFCGNANNAFDFYCLFERVFILDLPEHTQRSRMMSRTEHDFGQDKETQDIVIKRQKTLLQTAVALGAVVIDATPSPKIIADTILSHE
jgi:broad-specificity NMP kinase